MQVQGGMKYGIMKNDDHDKVRGWDARKSTITTDGDGVVTMRHMKKKFKG